MKRIEERVVRNYTINTVELRKQLGIDDKEDIISIKMGDVFVMGVRPPITVIIETEETVGNS